MLRTYRQVLKELILHLLDQYDSTGDEQLAHEALNFEKLWDELEEQNRLDTPAKFETTEDFRGLFQTISFRPYAVVSE